MSPPTSGQHDLDRILDRFEEAWRGGTPPRLEEYVPSEVNARREVLPELIKIDLEYRWCKARMPGQTVIPGAAPGERVQLEEYVRRFPELGPTDRLPAGLIAEEYRARSWAGERPKHQEFISRFGQRDTELRGLLEKIDAELKRESSPAVPTLVPGATLSDTGRSLPTVDSLLETLRSLPLLSESQLGTLLQDRSRFADARMLARHLLEQAWLTPYQVNQLVAGRAADLVLGPYILLERLGESFKGQVFKARHQRMNRLVALKMIRKELLANAETVRRFYREVQAAGLLSHPHVVHAFDAGPMGATHVLAMEFVDGIDLACLVKQSGPLPVAQACDYIRQAALGLQAIQDHGLIHRDIKPSNLLVSSGTANDRSPANHQVKVLDLGLALLHRPVDAQLTETLTQEGAVMGTPDFMAPEQAEDPHRVDVRADLYSLGCTLYYLLTGVVPFPAAEAGSTSLAGASAGAAVPWRCAARRRGHRGQADG
jgi:serine/threonine protein kinase